MARDYKFEFRLDNGQDGLLLSSYLQKFIRTGDHDRAYRVAQMFWPRYRTYIAKRLRQCLPEEIGLANLPIYRPVMFHCKRIGDPSTGGTLDDVKKAIWLLSTSEKNKWTDLAWIWHKFNPMTKDYPVKPLAQLEDLQDWLAYFLSEFGNVRQCAEVIESFAEPAAYDILKIAAEALRLNSNSKQCRGLGTWIFLAAQICHKQISHVHHAPSPHTTDVLINEDVRVQGVPSYFNDMHTSIGKKKGRDQIHWFKNCMKVNKYKPLAGDFHYDPLKTGFNQLGLIDPDGIKLEYLQMSLDDLSPIYKTCIPDTHIKRI
ncbi:hypothetical protein ACK8P5_26165 (plasmid) [Paenibacillus sp. EC2-1]|uniref:hypothetical protein n=1 Tax=Paenibacillus sp. EC2-1 TaxID=3388665 RepID=UPI003BEF24E5